MTTRMFSRCAPAALLLAALTLPAAVMADDPASCDKKKDDATVVIVGDGDETTTLTLEDGQLMVVTSGDGSESTRIIDVEAMGLLAADAMEGAMEGLDDLFAELGDMQFQYRAGQDNNINFSWDDSEIEIDLDEIMTQVAAALEHGLAEFDTDDWSDHHGRWDEVSEDELRTELENLKDEMRELKKELRKLNEAKSR